MSCLEMASHNEKDDVPILPVSHSSSSSRLANTSSTTDGFGSSTVVLGYAGPIQSQRRPPLVQMSGPRSSTRSREPPPPTGCSCFAAPEANDSGKEVVIKHSHLFRSGRFGMCNDPYCTTCPSYYHREAAQFPTSKDAATSGSTTPYINPHSEVAQYWKFFFSLSYLLAIFVDPLFVFLIRVKKDEKCLFIDWPMAKAYVAVRTLTDVLFAVNILLQFRMAYVAPESTVVGSGQLVIDPKKIARHYVRRMFWLDIIIVMPLAQFLILIVIPAVLGVSGANSAKNLLCLGVLCQYIPKLIRLVPLLAGETPTIFIFGHAWANSVMNLLTFMLAGHFIGSCWYLMGLQRLNRCLRQACGNSHRECRELIDCGNSRKSIFSEIRETLGSPAWKNNANASACFQENGFDHGIYLKAVNLTSHPSPIKRYIYSLFWGFQQISTLAGNQVPSYSFGEVFFTMGIIGLGLFLFAFLIGNMQNFLQGLGRRNLEMTLRRRDVDQWMSHRRLPENIRKRVQQAERFNWAATRGVNEEMLFENMPDDIQRDIRRHLFNFLDNVNIFSGMDELVLDAIRGRLKQKIYIKNSMVLHSGGLLDKMVFIVRGKMESIGEDGSVLHLSEGDVCGDELLPWCIERSSVNSDDTMVRLPSKGMLSKRSARCLTNVEAFSLSVADLEDVMSLFSRFLMSHIVQRADSSGLEIPKESAL